MLYERYSLGISTPGADPSDNYVWALLDRAEAEQPGAVSALRPGPCS
jgi:hypothetical protein